MRAREHTEQMLHCWASMHVDRADLVVRRSGGEWLWQRDLPLGRLPLAWARAENARGADVYIRPARHHRWPVVFLDDLDPALGLRIMRRYSALLVQTSREGGCHLWMLCSRPLSEPERRDAQRYLAARTGADRGSTSGEHLGRLAGMKNYKRRGQWTGVLGSSMGRPAWEPRFLDAPLTRPAASLPIGSSRVVERHLSSNRGIDRSPSGKEWGWAMGALAAGLSPARVYAALLERCLPRRGRDAQRYARRTVLRALRHLGRSDSL
jgi:hypothetical protein